MTTPDVRGSMYIDGQWCEAESGETKDVVNPATEEAFYRVASCGQAEVRLSICPISSHKQQIITSVQSITTSGSTAMGEGLEVARKAFDWTQQGVVRRIVLLTDGHHNAGPAPLPIATDLKVRGVIIDVTGIGKDPADVDEPLLRKLASVVEGAVRYRFIKDQQTLVDIYTQLANKTATGA